jgi:hypothetical protein
MSDESEKRICQIAKEYNMSIENAIATMTFVFIEISAEPCGYKLTPKFTEYKQDVLLIPSVNELYTDMKKQTSFDGVKDKKKQCEDIYKDYGPEIDNNGAMAFLE